MAHIQKSIGILSLFVAGIILTACGNTETPQAVSVPETYLRAPLSDKDINLDPSGDWLVSYTEVFNVIYDALFLIGRDGEILPGIASELPQISDDGKTYHIKLRQDARFHDDDVFLNGKGRAVKAEDFIYSIKRIADPKNETGLYSLVQGRIEGLDQFHEALKEGKGKFDDEIAGLRAINENELKIRLTKPTPQIIDILAIPSFSIVPREAVEKYGSDFKKHAVGTGPFRLKSYESKRIVVELVPGHWRTPTEKKEKLPDGIVFTLFDDPWNAFKNGELDILTIESRRLKAFLDDKFELKKELVESGYGVYRIKEAYRAFIIFNYKNPIMQNAHLRQAIAHAIPWKDIIDPADTLSASFIPETIPGYVNLQWEYNPEKAKKELALAGFPGGKGLPELRFRTPYSVRLFIAGMVEDALEKVDIPVRVEIKDEPELEDAHFGSQGWVLDYPDASSILTLLHSNAHPPVGNNYGYFAAKAYDNLLEDAQYEKIARWIYDQVVVIPFRQTHVFYGISPRIKTIEADPLGYLLLSNVELK